MARIYNNTERRESILPLYILHTDDGFRVMQFKRHRFLVYQIKLCTCKVLLTAPNINVVKNKINTHQTLYTCGNKLLKLIEG